MTGACISDAKRLAASRPRETQTDIGSTVFCQRIGWQILGRDGPRHTVLRCGPTPRHIYFVVYELHQPLLLTALPGNSWHGPYPEVAPE